MIDRRLRPGHVFVLALSCLTATTAALAGDSRPETERPAAPIAAVLAEMSEDVRWYNDHLVTLASPFMEGRVPGSRGMEVAKEYMEFWFRDIGLEPAFDVSESADSSVSSKSFRQGFPLGGMTTVETARLSSGFSAFTNKVDFTVTTMGGSGSITAPITFVGYAIEDGPDGYSSFSESEDLTGRIAMMLRFEPMDENGSSLWGEGRWSGRAGFEPKIRAAFERNAEAVIVVNTPGADDPRIETLMSARGGGNVRERPPVLMMSPDAASRLIGAGENGRPSLLQLRRMADMGRIVVDFDVEATIEASLKRESIVAENVGGLLPGKGDLADEIIVVGGHLDHLGMGFFGSRTGPGKLHPGADDNASGSAGVLLFAKNLKASYDALPDDADARSVLFVAFSGEESGLNGSRYYVENPIRPIEDHDLMINFDMIGRIQENRLSVSGANSAEGMSEWIRPFFEASPLEVIEPTGSGGGSDHLPFLRKEVPALFGIIADFHTDFHTPADTSDKINRVGAVDTINMFHDIALASAQREDRWQFTTNQQPAARGPSRQDIKVRFGVRPGTYEEDQGGVLIEEVTEGGSADLAKVRAGDILKRWDGKKVDDVMAWMGMLGEYEPGDKIKIGVVRDGKEITLDVTLQGR